MVLPLSLFRNSWDDVNVDIVTLYLYAFLIGSVPSAFLIGKIVKGIDIRDYGSGNVGGTNVYYHVGKVWLVPLGLFDLFGKGASPFWVGMYLLDLDSSSLHLVMASFGALIGNNWSIFLKFTGGRGIALVLGALFAIAPIQLGIFIATTSVGLTIFRSSAIWVLISLISLPLWTMFLGEAFDTAITSVWFLRIGGPVMITLLCIGFLFLVVLKRLLSNGQPLPKDMPLKILLVNRFLRDRDTKERSSWVSRVPQCAKKRGDSKV